MNVYKVRLGGGIGDATYDRLWSARTMAEAINLTFFQWKEDHEGEPREYFESEILRGVDMVGGLENESEDRDER